MRQEDLPDWVRQILEDYAELFPPADAEIWREWAEKSRGGEGLTSLVGSDVRLGFQARAVMILLMPVEDWNPFFWPRTGGPSYLEMSGKDWVQRLPETLLPFYTRVLLDICDALWTYLGHSHWNPVPAQYRLNELLLDLLMRAPENLREKVFERYPLNDPEEYMELEDASGYTPFARLMSQREVDEKWKRQADEMMRGIIRAELAEERQPRAEHEAALQCYVGILQQALYSMLPYSPELFASQLEFLLDLADEGNDVRNFNPWLVGRALLFILRDKRELRLRFVRFVVLAPHRESERFMVYDRETLATAEALLAEFGKNPDLAPVLHDLIEAGRLHLSAGEREALEQYRSEETLRAKMRWEGDAKREER